MKTLVVILFLFLIFSYQTYSQYYFELDDMEGNSVKLTELLKKGPVFIEFWALSCACCKDEMKTLQELYIKYKDSGFVVVAINQDPPKNSSNVRSFVGSKGYNFINILDPEATVFEKFGAQNLPFAVLMDKNGNIVKTYTGFTTGDGIELEADIKSVLVNKKN